MRHVGIVITNQPANYPGDTLTADLPQRIKGRNPNVVELLRLNHSSGELRRSPQTGDDPVLAR